MASTTQARKGHGQTGEATASLSSKKALPLLSSSPSGPLPSSSTSSSSTSSSSTSSSSTSSSTSSLVSAFFDSFAAVYGAAAALRLVLLFYGLWQDAYSPVKYTDIDYLVFTDAARFVARGQSPYARETYRYTPLLAWLLLPAGRAEAAAAGRSAWLQTALFASGKVLFAAADLVAGWLLERILRADAATPRAARIYAAVWLLNPMVAAISTRGSAEGLLGALVAALLWAVQVARRPTLAGVLLGAGVHLKIYPFIYAPAIVWWMDAERMGRGGKHVQTPSALVSRGLAFFTSDPSALVSRGLAFFTSDPSALVSRGLAFFTPDRLRLALASLATFAGLNAVMLYIYGLPFVQHTYLHHVTRIDHRHNFSPYNTQLYLSSATSAASSSPSHPLPPIESLAFAPQLLLATLLLPLVLAKKHLPTALLAQTFAFVSFNKVCTSQYFLWYLVLLPPYLPRSSFVRRPRLGLAAVALWVLGQAAWLQQGYALEFLGHSTFLPGLWVASLAFFLVNCWILGVIVGDAGGA